MPDIHSPWPHRTRDVLAWFRLGEHGTPRNVRPDPAPRLRASAAHTLRRYLLHLLPTPSQGLDHTHAALSVAAVVTAFRSYLAQLPTQVLDPVQSGLIPKHHPLPYPFLRQHHHVVSFYRPRQLLSDTPSSRLRLEYRPGAGARKETRARRAEQRL